MLQNLTATCWAMRLASDTRVAEAVSTYLVYVSGLPVHQKCCVWWGRHAYGAFEREVCGKQVVCLLQCVQRAAKVGVLALASKTSNFSGAHALT